jgi:hypothetical protein
MPTALTAAAELEFAVVCALAMVISHAASMAASRCLSVCVHSVEKVAASRLSAVDTIH